MKVLITKPFFPADLFYIKQKLLPQVELIIPTAYDETTLMHLAPEAEVLLGAFISKNLLQSAGQLKFIQIPWTGVDNLDYQLLNEHKVIVCNSHSNASIVAEHAVALMMDLAKKIAYHDRKMREGNWNRPQSGIVQEINSFSREIKGSTIAIIGYGSIGKMIKQFLSGYNCNFKLFKRDISKQIDGDNNKFYNNTVIKEQLTECDFVFLTIPLTQETKSLVNHTFFESMKRTACIINVSRGEIIDEQALYDSLSNKKIAGAAIDTWYNYPNKENPNCFPSKHYNFHHLDNLILSPHRAGFIEGSLPHLDDAIQNINNYAQGLPLKNIISFSEKY